MGPKSTSNLQKQIKRFIKEHSRRGQTMVVAVSGGTDSVCLLHLLAGLRDELGLSLHVAHLNHCLRGDESDADAQYVAWLANCLDIPSTIDRRDVQAYRGKHRLSLEEAAREVRYSFLAETARSIGVDTVAVGHTVDDNVETILMHLLRGSGTRGLRGLRSCSDIFGLMVLRPLLSASRQDTARYCRQNRLEAREDTSNLSLLPLRNRIRLELLPRLKEYNLQIEDALLRAAAIATTDVDFIDKATAVARDRIVKKQNGFFILSKGRFNRLHPALKRGLLRLLIAELLGNLMDIEAGHIESVLSSLDKQTGKKITLPDGLIFAIDYERYILGRGPFSLSPFPSLDGEYELYIPGETPIPGWHVTANVVDKPLTEWQDRFQACLDFDKAGLKLFVRTRRRGDRFRPLGLRAETRLSCFMIEAKIPQAWRDSIPLVCSEEGIVWVVGYRPDEGVKVTKDTKRALLLRFKPR